MDSEPAIVDIVTNGESYCVLAVGEDGRVVLWDGAGVPVVAASKKAAASTTVATLAAHATVSLVAEARKLGKGSKARSVPATPLPIAAARFLPPTAAGAAPRVLIARGSLVKPTFETLVCVRVRALWPPRGARARRTDVQLTGATPTLCVTSRAGRVTGHLP